MRFRGEGTELGGGGERWRGGSAGGGGGWGDGVGGGMRWMDWVVVEMGRPWAST